MIPGHPRAVTVATTPAAPEPVTLTQQVTTIERTVSVPRETVTVTVPAVATDTAGDG